MGFPLFPTWITSKITDISPEFLVDHHIRLLMLDFDNTIVPYTTNEPTPAVVSWLHQMQTKGFVLCIVSNSKRDRVPAFCEKYGLECITHARKPFPKGIQACLKRFNMSADQAVLVGDQIYTDTLGGNGAGVKTILVQAIHNHNIWLKLRHVAEMPFILCIKNRRMLK